MIGGYLSERFNRQVLTGRVVDPVETRREELAEPQHRPAVLLEPAPTGDGDVTGGAFSEAPQG